MLKALCIVLPLACLAPASAIAQDLSLPAIFSDHMVMQRSSTVPFWGKAAAGERVQLSGGWWAGTLEAVADGDGVWRVDCATPVQGGPYTISVNSGGEQIRYSDVVLGEVWLCGGQSNMEWTLGPGVGPGIQAWQEEAAAADLPMIRGFDVEHALGMEPQDDCSGQWQLCDPQTVRRFSAVGFLFGRELHRELGVPIGLIGCNWGGTLAEAWTSEETLLAHGGFEAPLRELQQRRGAPDQDSLSARQATWWTRLSKRDPGSARDGWMQASFNDQGWAMARVPGAWSGDLGAFDGVVWYRREVEIPVAWKGRELVLELGPIDDNDTTWFNGRRVGASHADGLWNQPRSYRVPASAVTGGSAVLAVRAVDTGGGGGFTGNAEQMRIHPQGEPGSSLPLAGDWRHQRGAAMSELGAFPTGSWFHANYPTALHNGMLRPVIPYAIRGAIWYQGESNRTRPRQYQTLFPAMIENWRALWGRGDFPFYFVQIAPFNYGGDRGQAAALREAQTMTLAVANTGMVVTMDIGNPGNIHPANKQDVGFRLAQWALAKSYGRELVYSGPLLRGHRREAGAIRLEFDHAAGGLTTRDGEAPSHFQIAGADRLWHAAQARIEHRADEGWTVVVASPAVSEPVAVRYAWGAADQPNLRNAAGLPAPSFRTDDWEAYPGQAPASGH